MERTKYRRHRIHVVSEPDPRKNRFLRVWFPVGVKVQMQAVAQIQNPEMQLHVTQLAIEPGL